jgi:hypothetical protein
MATVTELRAALAKAEEAERKSNRAKEEAAYKSLKELLLTDPWEYIITPWEYKQFMNPNPIKGATIERRLGPETIAEWEARTGFSFRDACNARMGGHDNTKWHGMFYYRTDENILTHDGGGTHVLRDPKLCSDEEWAQILSGNIPNKFKR